MNNILKYENDSLKVNELILNNNVKNNRLCHHRVKFLYMLREAYGEKIKNYLEIGVHNGCSMSYVVQSQYKLDNCIGIDLFEETFYKDKLNKTDIYEFINNNNNSKSNIKLIKGNTRNKNIIKQVSNIKYDLIFIDGDHSYEGVKADFENYNNLLSDTGFIVFDDYNTSNNNKGVYKFINELIKSNFYKYHYKYNDKYHKINNYTDGIILFCNHSL
jgi:predicted O-methyltransferase YrrM